MSKFPAYDLSLTPAALAFPIVIGLASRRGGYVPPHHHQFYEISLYVNGSAEEWVNGNKIVASRGTLVFKLPHQIHETRMAQDEYCDKYNLMFDLDYVLDAESEADLKRYFQFKSANVSATANFLLLEEGDTERLERLCRQILEEYSLDSPFRSSLIRAKLIEILVQIARCRGGEGADTAENEGIANGPTVPGYSPEVGESRTIQVLHYVNGHFLTDLSLEGLADRFGLSAPYLSKAIKRSIGMNYTEYIHELRIEMACSLLMSTRMSILEVSEEAGYRSFKTFSRVFLRKKGMSPTQYRQQHNEPSA